MSIEPYTLKDGRTRRWRVRYSLPNGKRTDKRGFARKIDAQRWEAANVTTAIALGTWTDPGAGLETIPRGSTIIKAPQASGLRGFFVAIATVSSVTRLPPMFPVFHHVFGKMWARCGHGHGPRGHKKKAPAPLEEGVRGLCCHMRSGL